MSIRLSACPILLVVGACLLAACGNSTSVVPPIALNCSATTPLQLAPMQDTLVDAIAAPCLTIPATGSSAAEYLFVAHSAAAYGTPSGVFTPYDWRSDAAASLASVQPRADASPDATAAFHATLRTQEARLAGALRSVPYAPPAAYRSAPPAVGDRRSFSVCADRTCSTFTSVTAEARAVGEHIAVFLDTSVPADGYSDADLHSVVALADQSLLPIDTLAFGTLPDIDGDARITLLLSPAVNRLSGACNGSGLIVGYFFGNDLLMGQPGSNNADMLYAIVPDVSSATCTVTKERALSNLPVTIIHEVQHMISFNAHVLRRGGSAELTWLNEGLSHFAEELGGRRIPPSPDATANQRLTQFVLADFDNAFGYLRTPESYFLVTPTTSTGSLGERGANWLFVRWLADHFGGGVDDGTPLTRALVQSSRVGLDNIETATSTSMRTLVAEWLLANALEADSTLVPRNPRLAYRSWNFQRTFSSLRDQDPGRFPRRYPLLADSTTGALQRTGTLRGGSGTYLRVRRAAGSPALTLRLTETAERALRATFAPGVVVFRVR